MKMFILLIWICLFPFGAFASWVIRINQLGYLPHSVKVAVFVSEVKEELTSFQVYETLSGKLVFEGNP